MMKIAIALIVSVAVIVFGHEHGTLFWVSAAISCAFLETVLFNNIVFFIPASSAAAGGFSQFFLGNTQTATMIAAAACVGTLLLLSKELTLDKRAQAQVKQNNMKKLRT